MIKLFNILLGFLFFGIAFSGYSQCLDDDIIMYPPKSTDLFTGFGRDIELVDNYLITSANNSDSIAYESGAVMVYEFVDNEWKKIADLTPSEPVKGLQLGHFLKASSDIIAAKAYTYTDSGHKYEVIYVFEKESNQKWTSMNESYILNPVPDIYEQYNGDVSITFDINDDLLWVYHKYTYYTFDYKAHNEAENRVFKLNKSTGIQVDAIAAQFDEDSSHFYHPLSIDLEFGQDFMVMSLEDYRISEEGGSGKVLVYNNDVIGGWNQNPVELTRSYPRQYGFGSQIYVHNDVIFVANYSDARMAENSWGKVFIYKRIGEKWSSSDEMAVLSIPDITPTNYDRLVANDEYVFYSFPAKQKIAVFAKEEAEWESKNEPDFTLNLASEERGYGWELAASENHFVYNANDFAYSKNLVNGSELYSVTLDDDFEQSLAAYDQVLYIRSSTSSGDEFSRNSSFYKSLGAVGTNLDNDKGYASGALNLYERNSEDLSWTRTGKLYAPDAQAYHNFGRAVAITENYLFSSAPYYDSVDVNGDNIVYNMGKVYQFKRVDGIWEYMQQIFSPDIGLAIPESSAANELSDQKSQPFHPDFRVKSVLDDLAPNSNIKEGSFRNEAHTSINQIFNVRDYDTYREFGKSIVYNNGYLAIGQRASNYSGHKGRIYIFKESNDGSWKYIATMQTSDEYESDLIGDTPFIMNDSMIVTGSPNYIGHAFVFKREHGKEWESKKEDAILLPDRAELISSGRYSIEEFDSFGASVDMYGNNIVVGAPRGERDDRSGPNSGRAYVFEMPQGGWKGEIPYKHILKPEERILDGNFGYSVYIDQNNILVGAPHSIHRRGYADSFYSDGVEKRGRVYVFDRNLIDEDEVIINEVGQILPSEGHSYDLFGAKIEKNFLEVVISSPLADTENGDRSGSAYMFKKVGAIEEDIQPLCKESGVIDLVAYPVTGGVWSGEGIIDSDKGLFDPSGLEEAFYEVSYQYGECITSTNIAVYTKPSIVERSDQINYICIGGEVELSVDSDKSYHGYRWFYRASTSGAYSPKYQWDNNKVINATDDGFYYCISINPGCSSDPVYFEVIRVDESIQLNHEESTNYCQGESKILSLIASTEMDSYDWKYSLDKLNTDFQSIASTKDFKATNSGWYFCEFEYLGCNFYSDTVNLEFNIERSILNYSNHHELCLQETISLGLLEDDTMTEYEWYWDKNGQGDFVTFDNGQDLVISEEGYYYCRSYSASGCTYVSDTLKVSQEQVSLSFAPIGHICDDSEFIPLTVSPPGGSFFILNSNVGDFQDPIIDPKVLDNGVHEVVYEYEINDCKYQISQTFEMDIIDNEEIFIPNVFTPNHDGINDTFYLTSSGRLPLNFNIVIINREGLIVFESNQFDFHWKGDDQNNGVYFWSMSYGNACDQRQSKGYVHLIK